MSLKSVSPCLTTGASQPAHRWNPQPSWLNLLYHSIDWNYCSDQAKLSCNRDSTSHITFLLLGLQLLQIKRFSLLSFTKHHLHQLIISLSAVKGPHSQNLQCNVGPLLRMQQLGSIATTDPRIPNLPNESLHYEDSYVRWQSWQKSIDLYLYHITYCCVYRCIFNAHNRIPPGCSSPHSSWNPPKTTCLTDPANFQQYFPWRYSNTSPPNAFVAFHQVYKVIFRLRDRWHEQCFLIPQFP